MIVDASVIVAIVLREPGSELLPQRILASAERRMSAITAVEVVIVMMARLPGRSRSEVAQAAFETIEELGIEIVAVSPEDAIAAANLYAKQGRGAGTAGLNLGDVFVAAPALERGEPILAAGTDEFTRAGLPQVT